VSFFSLAESRNEQAGRSLDIPGAATITAGLAVLVYGIVGTDSHPWTSAHTIVSLAVGVALLLAFAIIELRVSAQPLVPFGIFRLRNITAANAVAFMIGAALFANYFFLTLYLQQVNGYSPLKGGLAFLPAGLFTLAGSLAGTKLVATLGPRRQLTIGPVLATAGMVWLTFLSPHQGYWAHVFVPLVLIGLGLGMSFVPMTLAATAGLPPHQAGLASGLLNTTRQVGGAVGLAIMATIAAHVATSDVHRHIGPASALTSGYDVAFGVAAGVLLAAAGLARLLPARRPADSGATAPQRGTGTVRQGTPVAAAEL
jgi:predicted MFS family arabinose efflux permease